MTAVIDASVFVAALVGDGADGEWSRDAISEGRLAAPELALAEAANILRRLEISSEITQSVANRAHAELIRLDEVARERRGDNRPLQSNVRAP